MNLSVIPTSLLLPEIAQGLDMGDPRRIAPSGCYSMVCFVPHLIRQLDRLARGDCHMRAARCSRQSDPSALRQSRLFLENLDAYTRYDGATHSIPSRGDRNESILRRHVKLPRAQRNLQYLPSWSAGVLTSSVA